MELVAEVMSRYGRLLVTTGDATLWLGRGANIGSGDQDGSESIAYIDKYDKNE
jgi:hypothetical protein